ncbi:MAG: c-type cytochrome [Anaerolineae bacterium]|nr:c-type cytochrome [Anaerolineae bacterium]
MSVQFKILIGILFTAATVIVMLIYWAAEDARMANYTASFEGRAIQAGAESYELYCATCHGEHGDGIVGKGPPLNRKDLLDLKNTPYLKAIQWNGTTHDFIKNTIAAGRPQFSAYYANEGYTEHMPTWSQDYGGPLRPDQVDSLTAFVLNWAPGEFDPIVAIVTPTPGPTPTPIPLDQLYATIPFPASPPSEDILNAGKAIYDKNCAACHGEGLGGDGPGATGAVKPRNFTDCTAMEAFDMGQHHNAVVNGKTATGMPAWGPRLSDEEIWQVIMYERSPCKLYVPQ